MSGKYRFYIGIDTGVNTGFAIWDAKEKKLLKVDCLKIHKAMEYVRSHDTALSLVRVEDARLRTWFPKTVGKEQLQGAGSIKRDAGIWEDFLKDNNAHFEMVAPKNNKTKLTAEYFKKVTGWAGKTNQHGRDAAFLVFGY